MLHHVEKKADVGIQAHTRSSFASWATARTADARQSTRGNVTMLD